MIHAGKFRSRKRSKSLYQSCSTVKYKEKIMIWKNLPPTVTRILLKLTSANKQTFQLFFFPWEKLSRVYMQQQFINLVKAAYCAIMRPAFVCNRLPSLRLCCCRHLEALGPSTEEFPARHQIPRCFSWFLTNQNHRPRKSKICWKCWWPIKNL